MSVVEHCEASLRREAVWMVRNDFILKAKRVCSEMVTTSTCPRKSSRFLRSPHGAMPMLTIFDLALEVEIAPSSAADTCLTTPAFIPDVMIHAPVVRAAFNRPLRKTRASLGWRLNKMRVGLERTRILGLTRSS